MAHDGLGPSVGVGLSGRGHAGEAEDLAILIEEAECPHQALAEFGVLRLDILEDRSVGSFLVDFVHPYVHVETHELESSLLVTWELPNLGSSTGELPASSFGTFVKGPLTPPSGLNREPPAADALVAC